ncbi:MAG: hypothetical protein R3Y63_13215 [Eubacteriales bacterium]
MSLWLGRSIIIGYYGHCKQLTNSCFLVNQWVALVDEISSSVMALISNVAVLLHGERSR